MAKQTDNQDPGSAPVPLKGLVKAAILLVTLEPEGSSAVMRELDTEMVEDVTRAIAQLDVVSAERRGRVVEEFYNLALARQYLKQGGVAYARTLLEKALPADQANHILTMIEHEVYKRPFAFLAKTDAENLLTFIQDEHPQTIALILSHIPANKAAEIMAGLAPEKQLEVVARVAGLDNTNPEGIKEGCLL